MDKDDVYRNLIKLFDEILAQPFLKKGAEWAGKSWPEWDEGKTWKPEENGVYILWNEKTDNSKGIQPIYIGEGITGKRVWDSFQKRVNWHYAQILYSDIISNKTKEATQWRKLLERFCIVVLNPIENKN
ncbi:MAG: hypothetical protein JW807_12700 [Spirochaetes bacterium]|nr:hypothetical protein [Spirochaetota bacterium]